MTAGGEACARPVPIASRGAADAADAGDDERARGTRPAGVEAIGEAGVVGRLAPDVAGAPVTPAPVSGAVPDAVLCRGPPVETSAALAAPATASTATAAAAMASRPRPVR